MRWVNTYRHYNGKAFVAAQIRRRRMIVWRKAAPDSCPVSMEAIEESYLVTVKAHKRHAHAMVEKYGPRIQVDD